VRSDCVGPLVVGKEEENVWPVCPRICASGRGMKMRQHQREDEEGEASWGHFLRGKKTEAKTTKV